MVSIPLAIIIAVAYVGWVLWYSQKAKKETDKSVQDLSSAIETLVKSTAVEAVREAQSLTEEERNTLRYMGRRAREDYPEVSADDIGDLLNIIARLSPDAKEVLENAPNP